MTCSICGSTVHETRFMSQFRSFRAVAGPLSRICRYCFREIVPFKIISLLPVTVQWERFGKPGSYNKTVRLNYKDWRCSCKGSKFAPFSCYHMRRLYHDEGLNRIPVYRWPRKIGEVGP